MPDLAIRVDHGIVNEFWRHPGYTIRILFSIHSPLVAVCWIETREGHRSADLVEPEEKGYPFSNPAIWPRIEEFFSSL